MYADGCCGACIAGVVRPVMARSPMNWERQRRPRRSRPRCSDNERRRRDRQRAFSINEFSRVYGIGRSKIYQELSSGRLRGRKIGRRTIIAEVDAEDWWLNLPTVGEES